MTAMQYHMLPTPGYCFQATESRCCQSEPSVLHAEDATHSRIDGIESDVVCAVWSMHQQLCEACIAGTCVDPCAVLARDERDIGSIGLHLYGRHEWPVCKQQNAVCVWNDKHCQDEASQVRASSAKYLMWLSKCTCQLRLKQEGSSASVQHI